MTYFDVSKKTNEGRPRNTIEGARVTNITAVNSACSQSICDLAGHCLGCHHRVPGASQRTPTGTRTKAHELHQLSVFCLIHPSLSLLFRFFNGDFFLNCRIRLFKIGIFSFFFLIVVLFRYHYIYPSLFCVFLRVIIM